MFSPLPQSTSYLQVGAERPKDALHVFFGYHFCFAILAGT